MWQGYTAQPAGTVKAAAAAAAAAVY